MALFLMGRDREAASLIPLIQTVIPEDRAWYAATYAFLGEDAAAREMADRFESEFGAIWQGDPSAGTPEFAHWVAHVSNPIVRPEHRQRLIEGMGLAGLPI